MWERFRVIWQIPELRNKILWTLLFLAIYRVGFQIHLPVIDAQAAAASRDKSGGGGVGDILRQVAVFSASELDQATIFGLGIMPYISASIIFQLLGTVVPSLERLQKEGEAGRKKINEYTRYATVVLCIIQSWFYLPYIESQPGFIHAEFLNSSGRLMMSWYVVSILIMTAGTIFLMWIGEQIDEFGIGNGISLLIMGGILARMPGAGMQLLEKATLNLGEAGRLDPAKLMLLAAIFLAVVVGVVFITKGQRRIPMQSAKHVRGRRVFGGTRQYLPLRVNQAGVMPIIFASSLLMFPMLIITQLTSITSAGESTGFWGRFWQTINDIYNHGSYVYNVCYLILIYFFCYFWTAITFNPKDMAENLKNFGSFIPGYRPGKRTADYLEKVMVRITYVGAGFLAAIAIVPVVINAALDVPWGIASFYGGTSLLIAVSVALDLVQKIDSHLVMRNYKGLLE